MPTSRSRATVDSIALRNFETISDSEMVDAMLDERTKDDPCPGFSTLIGTTTKRCLRGANSECLAEHGLVPNVYLAIRWWCLLFIPLVPLGAYAVSDYKSIAHPFSDPHSRAFPVAMDWRQARLQGAIGIASLALPLLIGLWVRSL